MKTDVKAVTVTDFVLRLWLGSFRAVVVASAEPSPGDILRDIIGGEGAWIFV